MTVSIFPTLNLLARPGIVPAGLAVTRAGSASRIDALGALAPVAADTLRHDHHRVSGVYRGWRLEGARTNLLHNSLTPATQAVTLAAGTYTLSVAGPGSAALSGAASGTATEDAPLTVSTGGGASTVTVSGSPFGVQLESGSYATSIIPTAGAQVTRAAETVSIATADFPFNPAEGTLYIACSTAGIGGLQTALELGDGSAGNRIVLRFDVARAPQALVFAGGATLAALDRPAVAADQPVRLAFAYAAGDCAFCQDGGTVQRAAPASLPPATHLWLGSEGTATDPLNGHIRHVAYFPRRLADADLQLLTR